MKEDTKNKQTTKLWRDIFEVVSKIPRKDVEGYAMNYPSAATEIEALLTQQAFSGFKSPKEINDKYTKEFAEDKIWQYEKCSKSLILAWGMRKGYEDAIKDCSLAQQSVNSELDFYANELNRERIKTYTDLSERYLVTLSSIRDIFDAGLNFAADKYKAILSASQNQQNEKAIDVNEFTKWFTDTLSEEEKNEFIQQNEKESDSVGPWDEINGKFYPFYMIGGKKYYHYIQGNLVEFDTKEQANEYLED